MTNPSDWISATLEAGFHATTYAVVSAAVAGALRSPTGEFDIRDLRAVPVCDSSRKRGIRALRAGGFLEVIPTVGDYGRSGRSVYRLTMPDTSLNPNNSTESIT